MTYSLPRATAAWGMASFSAVLSDELQTLGLALPVQAGCLAGGFPEAPRVSDLANITADAQHIRATFTLTFTERAQPGCGGGSMEHHRQLPCALTLDRATGTAAITVQESEPLDEF